MNVCIRAGAVLCCLALVPACESGAAESKKVDAGAPAKAAAPADEAVPSHLVTMDHNFSAATDMLDAVVAGNLEIAQAHAEQLVKMPTPQNANEFWTTRLDKVRDLAGEVVKAKDLSTAAAASARVLVACSACHQTLKGPTPVPADDMPVQPGQDPSGLDESTLLEQHQWATDRVVDGLYFPDDASWKAGAAAFSSALLVPKKPTTKKGAPVDKKGVKAAQGVAKQVHAMKLGGAADQDARAAALGKLLPTCVSCHDALEVKIRPPARP